MACSTQKNTLVNRSYHELTAYYNVYFNGNEALKAGLLKVENQIEEDYTQLLPIYKESLPQVGELVSSDMDIAVEKGTKLIKFHSITKPPKSKAGSGKKRKPVKPEYNRFVDDAYLLMGRAFLYKKDYFRANGTFSLIIKNYKDDPVKFEASVWLVRTLTESGRYTEASELIAILEKDQDFPKALEGELAIASADLNIRQNRFEDAISFLTIGIKKIKGNKRKSRYAFILAQLYQETKNYDQALMAYRQVIRRRPNYEMLFNARINSAKVLSGEGNVAELKKELNKMRRQKRNQRYLDQIYYALANIAQSEGKVDDAIRNYQLSVANSSENIHQRALSSITLANLYFDKKEYIRSGLYFDSAMVVIDENYPNYETISRQYNSLNQLVSNLNTVIREDSLQKLAAMNEGERSLLIKKWIDLEKTRQAEALLAQAEGNFRSTTNRSYGRNLSIGTETSSWYFYNPSTVAYGKKEFQKLWGERPVEDNWRRSNKTESSDSEAEETTGDELKELAKEKEKARIDDPTKPEYYLQDLPINDTLLQASHNRIKDALFDAGTLFKNEYSAWPQSIGCFRELDRRYPETQYKLPSYFNLWDLYGEIEKPDSANYFKSWIIEHYPNSNYAKFLVNPNYFIELEAQKDSINRLYQVAFTAYKSRNYSLAADLANQASSLKPDSVTLSKLWFIRMVSLSRSLPARQFADSLDHYVETFPNAEPVELALQIKKLLKEDKYTDYQEMVKSGYINDFIRNQEVLEKQTGIENEVISKWDKSNDLLHYFVIAFPSGAGIDLNRLKFDLANYNLDHYTSRDFDIETETLNEETQLLVVRNLDNKESAMIYFLSIIRKPEVFKTLAGNDFMNFIVSNNNYRQMISDRSYNDYLTYFVKHYSSFTKGGFTEEELDSPEMLMARKAREEQELVEQGEFVLIETGKDTQGNPETVKEQLFKSDYNQAHSLVVYVKQRGFRTGLMMRSFVQYNSTSHRDKRLRVTPGMAPEGTLLQVLGFPNAYEARNYLITVQDRKELYQSLGDIPYSLYIITEENLEKLQESGKVDEYDDFHKRNYLQRKLPNPSEINPKSLVPGNNKAVSTEAPVTGSTKINETNTQQKSITPAEPVIKPAVVTTDSLPADNKPKNVTPLLGSQNQNVQEIIREKPIQGTPAVDSSNTVSTVAPQPNSNSLFSFEPESEHKVIYLVPTQGFNPTLLLTYLKRYNATTNGNQNLSVSNALFDDKLTMIIVEKFNGKEAANAYLRGVSSDQRVNLAVRNSKYHLLAISSKNHTVLLDTKKSEEYLNFFNQFYK